jgi:hypothetical protein
MGAEMGIKGIAGIADEVGFLLCFLGLLFLFFGLVYL